MANPNAATTRQALTVTRDLWRWLQANPDKEKDQWPGWQTLGKMSSDCACCEYCDTHNLQCWDCPMASLWPRVCVIPGTPYTRWLDGNEYERAKAAKEIADHAEAELAKLPPEGAA